MSRDKEMMFAPVFEDLGKRKWVTAILPISRRLAITDFTKDCKITVDPVKMQLFASKLNVACCGFLLGPARCSTVLCKYLLANFNAPRVFRRRRYRLPIQGQRLGCASRPLAM